ncbi:MAG: hypothetical protein HN348_31520, partial [Proteobacteria bacterium]|nr:hypothetical protein [Pseudomonadota bacterium]
MICPQKYPVLPFFVAMVITSDVWASGPIKTLLAGPDVELSRVVDVPLVRGPSTGFLPAVVMEVGDERMVGRLDIGFSWSQLGQKTADALDLRVRTAYLGERVIRYAIVAEAKIGDVILRDLPVQVGGKEGLTLGLLTLPVGTALESSTGTVHFIPIELVGDHQARSEQVLPIDTVKGIRWLEHGRPRLAHGPRGLVESWALRSAKLYTTRASTVDLPASVGGLSIGMAGVDESLGDRRGLSGDLGWDVLVWADMVLNPVAETIGFSMAEEPSWSSTNPGDWFLPVTDDSRLWAEAAWKDGRLDFALKQYREGEDCASKLLLGRRLRQAGQLEEAQAVLAEAAEEWQVWADRDVESRRQMRRRWPAAVPSAACQNAAVEVLAQW